eukprot:gene4714-5990_t
MRTSELGGAARRGTAVIELRESGGVRGEAHNQLVAKGGHYASLWQMQMADSGSPDMTPRAGSPVAAAALSAPYGAEEDSPASPPRRNASTASVVGKTSTTSVGLQREYDGGVLDAPFSPVRKKHAAVEAGEAVADAVAADDSETKARVAELVLQCPAARRWIAAGLAGCVLNAMVMPTYAFLLAYVMEEFTNLDPDIAAWKANMTSVNGTWGKYSASGWQPEA